MGVGSIGLRVAEIAHHCYRMQVLGFQRRLQGLPGFAEGCALDELLARSRGVVLTCPLTEAMRGLLDARRAGRVRRTTPLLHHPLKALPQVLLTPHAAGLTDESMAAMSEGAADEVLRLLQGQAPLNPVNR